MKEFSFTLLNEVGATIKEGNITEDDYNKVLFKEQNGDIKLHDKWTTNFNTSVLYGREYRINNNILFLWMEVA